MSKRRFAALAVINGAAVQVSADRHANHHRAGECVIGTPANGCQFIAKLHHRRPDIVEELNLGNRFEATDGKTNRAAHPGLDYTIPFGKAKTIKLGQTLTIITYGALVQKSLQAALQIEQRRRGTSIEIIDLRSLSPYDWEAISASVRKTNRVLIAHEDTQSWGYGAEIAARIANELFTELDAPVGRVAALDTWVAYHPRLEEEILPQVEDFVREAERLLAF